MKPSLELFQVRMLCALALGIGSSFILVSQCGTGVLPAAVRAKTSIQWSQIGIPSRGTGVDCQGGGLAVAPSAEGARLRCVFQLLEGEAPREGLWLTSTVVPPGVGGYGRFRIMDAAVGREC